VNSRYLLVLLLLVEWAIVPFLFWSYGSDWRDQEHLGLVIALLALLAATNVLLLHRLGDHASASPSVDRASLAITCIGVVIMLFALIVGSHLSLTVVVYGSGLQIGLQGLALWFLWRRSRGPAIAQREKR